MKYRWHSLRLVILVLQKSLACSSTTNRDKIEKEKKTKRNNEHKKNITFIALINGRKEEGTSVSRST